MSAVERDVDPRFFNRTRRVKSIPRQLLDDRRPYLVPLYYILLSSDLAREGIENSGSFRFADHLYRRRPSGRWVLGTALDWLLLQFPSSRSFQNRYIHARDAIVEYVGGHPREESPSVLSVPCGIARELIEAARCLRRADRGLHDAIRWVGLDLDPAALRLTEQLASQNGQWVELRCGDALDPASYPPAQSLITSTGLGEFLSDDELLRFYLACRGALRSGGWFVTSGMQRHSLSDYLMRALGDVRVRYRGAEALTRILEAAGFSVVRATADRVGLQTLVVAARP